MVTVNSKFATCIEDCISVVRKIVYDVRSNSFVDFTSPLDENGISQMKGFQTDCIEDFKHWYQQQEIFHLVNLHMIQPICATGQNMSSFPFAACRTNGKYTFNNIIRCWFCIFEESSSQDSRIVGFSTDANSRYLLAMRFLSVFFNFIE